MVEILAKKKNKNKNHGGTQRRKALLREETIQERLTEVFLNPLGLMCFGIPSSLDLER